MNYQHNTLHIIMTYLKVLQHDKKILKIERISNCSLNLARF